MRIVNTDYYRQAELPAANGIADARSLARMYAALAGGGEVDGVRLVSPAVIDRFTRPDATTEDTGSTYGLGYHFLSPPFAVEGAGDGAFGHGGAGGQLAFADPERGLSFGFVKTQMALSWSTAAAVGAAVYSCL
jgi:CubicO group peptidase (beta-lactamase class C family)